MTCTEVTGPTPDVDYAAATETAPGIVRPAVPTWWRPDMPALYGGERVRVWTAATEGDPDAGVVGTVKVVNVPSSNAPIVLVTDAGHRWPFGFPEDRWALLVEAETDG